MPTDTRILEHRPDGVLIVQRGREVFEIAPDGMVILRRVSIWTWLAACWSRSQAPTA